MNKAEKAKAYREELKAEGYCPRCYKRKAVAGKLHCKECEKYYYAYYHAHKAQRREKLKAAGLMHSMREKAAGKRASVHRMLQKITPLIPVSRAFALLFILQFFKKRLDNRTRGGYNIDKR